ncbi:hypothetical protein FIBSPDRAFT_1042339 [Athelia psychrophila]|uniref:RNI-like protein n=1 Tax=Athelia psychrophila TaxID=1759441 RepID=A0A166MTH3_9AGAM|nr:hypothetical protein FIBSPDRAFT_1042339 [Fibularhizoctonia sp. CBS 109695]
MSTIPAHLAFEDTAAANMLLPHCAPLAHLRSMELRNLEWAALSPDACAPLTSAFTALTALGIHRATFPHAQTLRRLVASFPALERLALSDISVVPCLCNAYQPSERAAAMIVPKGLRSLTLDMGDAANGKRSQAEELLEWLANGDGCAKLATLDVRGVKRASFPALASFLSALPALEHLRLAFLEDIGADDLEAAPIHLQASLKTLHITAPSLASPILLLPSLPLLSRSSSSPGMGAALTLTLPSLGPTPLRRLPWAKLIALLPQSPSSSALKVRVYGWPESILSEISTVLSQPQCLGSLERGAWSAEAFSRTYALESDSDAHHGYPHTRAQRRKAGRAASPLRKRWRGGWRGSRSGW